MKKKLASFLIITFLSNVAFASDGIISVKSNYSAKETANRFINILQNKGLTLFARINHTKNAEKINSKIKPTEVIIFGNPKVGTPLMQCSQAVAIDLPQKVLIWEDSSETVWFSYNDPEYLRKRHNISGCDAVIGKIASVLGKISTAATTK